MKNYLILGVAVGLISGAANATKARMSALGQTYGAKSLGSFYLEDNRNIWRSAGAVSDLGSHMTFEHGTNYQDATGASQEATAEGGVFTMMGSHQIGVYINGNQGNAAWGNELGNGPAQPGRVDLFLGKSSFHDLGLRLGYAKINHEGLDTESSGIDFSVSGSLGGVNLWLNYVPALESTVAGVDIENDADMNLGFTYDVGHYKVFAEYEEEGNTKAVDSDTSMVVGLARVYTHDDHISFFDVKVVSTEDSSGNSFQNIPLTFGVEAKATDWLLWRLSIAQDLMDDGDDNVSARTTRIGAGAALTYGDMTIEGSLTNLDNTAAANTRLGTNGLLSNVSVTYQW